MKALTIYQPYASLISVGAKKIETRSWPTNYRGTLLIHAGWTATAWIDELINESPFREALEDSIHGLSVYAGNRLMKVAAQKKLPRGVIVATATLKDCLRLPGVGDRTPSWLCEMEGTNEMLFGDFGPGRYAWILNDIKKLPEPIPVRGMQGLWTPSQEIAEQIERQAADVKI